MIPSRTLLHLPTAILLLAGAAAVLRAEDYSITTLAGTRNVTGNADGTPGTFNNPYGLALGADKNLYVADTQNNTIRKITPSRVVSTLAGAAGSLGASDGTGSAARFNFPVGVAADASGNVYVADAKNFTIRKVTAAGVVTTYAGAPFQIGSTDGPAASARFFLPYGVAVDGSGNVFVADGGNHLIRKISAAGVVATLAGGVLQSGLVDGTGTAARFNTPWGLALDGSGNLYVADSENNAIRRVSPSGVVTTIAGNSGNIGAQDGAAAGAGFNQPRGVAVDAAGNVFVADQGNSTLRLITPGGTVSTLAGSAGIVGDVDSVGAAARFYYPTSVVVDGNAVYVSDSSNNLVRRGVPASAAELPVISVQPLEQVVSTGQAVTFRVVASGGNLSYLWLKNLVVIPGATSSTFTIGSAQIEDEGVYSARVSGAGGAVDSEHGSLTVTPVGNGPITITARPLSVNVSAGQSATFSVTAAGAGLTYQWLKNGAAIAGANGASYSIPSVQNVDAGTYTVRLTSGATTETVSAKLFVGSGGGVSINITTQPASQTVDAGKGVTFTVAATGTTALSYQWFKNDNAITGSTNPSLAIAATASGDAGNYTVRVSGGGLNVLSSTATLTVKSVVTGPTARLSNLSVRTAMAASGRLIVGFVVDGGGTRDILVRAAGPALAAFGLTGAMADPRLELYNGSTVTLTNDDWALGLKPIFASVGAFAFTDGSKDAGFLQAIEGSRSVHALGTGPGVVLVEAYDTGTGFSPRLVNVSARNQVGTGDDILIAGVTIAGTGTKRVLIRAVGPTLGVFGVSGFLVDPKLEVYRGETKLTENDDWNPALTATFGAVGAFQLAAGSKDAALVVDLTPDSYTVQVRGADGGTGEALVEVYEVP